MILLLSNLRRPRAESNRRIRDLQSLVLPLDDAALLDTIPAMEAFCKSASMATILSGAC